MYLFRGTLGPTVRNRLGGLLGRKMPGHKVSHCSSMFLFPLAFSCSESDHKGLQPFLHLLPTSPTLTLSLPSPLVPCASLEPLLLIDQGAKVTELDTAGETSDQTDGGRTGRLPSCLLLPMADRSPVGLALALSSLGAEGQRTGLHCAQGEIRGMLC